MGAQFGNYSPIVQLGVTWTETITLTDEDGNAIDLTGKSVRAQIRADYPERDGTSATPVPVMEITTVGYYATAPTWPVVEGFTVSDPTSGTIELEVGLDDLWTLSPSNAKARYRWSVVLANGDDDTVPVISGTVVVLPAVTI